ncbi:hypothetical protein HPB48_025110 [Haemaphysalis longicornis]|uniref:Uncharacterized protein n=1 Tax=Haemaphysalis longicornis TaxID=44386 RepID=A0A9J6H8W6_HAELO|nr:hypothetical protein HPB48_025110 [Haemaphysalis longicornis]
MQFDGLRGAHPHGVVGSHRDSNPMGLEVGGIAQQRRARRKKPYAASRGRSSWALRPPSHLGRRVFGPCCSQSKRSDHRYLQEENEIGGRRRRRGGGGGGESGRERAKRDTRGGKRNKWPHTQPRKHAAVIPAADDDEDRAPKTKRPPTSPVHNRGAIGPGG